MINRLLGRLSFRVDYRAWLIAMDMYMIFNLKNTQELVDFVVKSSRTGELPTGYRVISVPYE
jgi:hypothetical protein